MLINQVLISAGRKRFVKFLRKADTHVPPYEERAALIRSLAIERDYIEEEFSTKKKKNSKNQRLSLDMDDSLGVVNAKGILPNHVMITNVSGLRKVAATARPIDETNVGNKLLRSMGWTGGGLGARNQGIENPIDAYVRADRRGLG